MKQTFYPRPAPGEIEPFRGRAPITLRVITHPRRRELRLVCYGKHAATRLRGFLREHGIRPQGSSFQELPSNPFDVGRRKPPVAVYRLQGDAWLRIRSLGLPETTWAKLSMVCIGEITAHDFLG